MYPCKGRQAVDNEDLCVYDSQSFLQNSLIPFGV